MGRYGDSRQVGVIGLVTDCCEGEVEAQIGTDRHTDRQTEMAQSLGVDHISLLVTFAIRVGDCEVHGLTLAPRMVRRLGQTSLGSTGHDPRPKQAGQAAPAQQQRNG